MLQRDLLIAVVLILLPHLEIQAYMLKPEQEELQPLLHFDHLTAVEHVVTLREPQSARLTRRQTNNECNQERIDSMLRSCEIAASTPVPSPTPMVGTESTLDERTVDAPLYFCGPNCSGLAFLYAAECGVPEFIINVTGSCKLRGSNLILQCIYSVVIVKRGITACTRMILDVESSDEEMLFDPTKEYVEDQCCSLETNYSDALMFNVYVDRMGNAVTEPPLVPPWLMSNSSEYQPVMDITSTDLCTVAPTTLSTTELSSTAANMTDDMVTETTNAAAHTISLYTMWHIFMYCCLCFILSL